MEDGSLNGLIIRAPNGANKVSDMHKVDDMSRVNLLMIAASNNLKPHHWISPALSL